MASLKRFF